MREFAAVSTANRACALLYSFLRDHNEGVWLVPVNVCPDVPLTFCAAKVQFEFVDIDSETFCIDEEETINRLIKVSSKYAGIVYVRTYGYMSDTNVFFNKCHEIKPSLQIIDDRCLCMPSFSPDMYGADMVLYSTGHCKQIDLGGGGLAYYKRYESYKVDRELVYDATDESSIYKKSYEANEPMESIPQGWLKMDNYIDYQLYIEKIESEKKDRIKIRENINAVYDRNLSDFIKCPSHFQDWRYNIRVPSHLKEPILNDLFANNLFASSHYHSANRLFDKNNFVNSESLFASVINLFNDKYYSVEKAEQTCSIINKYFIYQYDTF